MTTVLLTLAAVAALLWARSRKTTTPEPMPEPGEIDPPVGMDAIPGNPTTPTAPRTRGTTPLPAMGPTLTAGIPSRKSSKTAAKGLGTRTRAPSPPQGVKLPEPTIPTFRPAVSVLDTMLDRPVDKQIAPIPPRPGAMIDSLVHTSRPSLLDQILDSKQVMQ